MRRFLKKYYFIIIILAIVTAFGCASARKNPYAEKKRKAGLVNTSNLGRNKYFFSNSYQKKLNKTFKKKRY
jgi:hypothetical protein